MDDKIKVGLISVGGRGVPYFDACRRFENLELVAWSAPYHDPAAVTSLVKDTPPCIEIHKLLADPEIKLVINATHTKGHTAFALAALAAGKSVYTKMPFAAEPGEIRRILTMARERQLLIGAEPDTYLSDGMRACRRFLEEQEIGSIRSIQVEAVDGIWNGYHRDPDFYYRYAFGPIYQTGLSCVNALISLQGPIVQVSATQQTKSVQAPEGLGGITSEAGLNQFPFLVEAVLTFANGVTCHLQTQFVEDAVDSWTQVELNGTDGTLILPNLMGYERKFTYQLNGQTNRQAIAATESGHPQSFGLGLWMMAEALRGEIPDTTCATYGLLSDHAIDVVWSITQSARLGKRVAVRSALMLKQIGFDQMQLDAYSKEHSDHYI